MKTCVAFFLLAAGALFAAPPDVEHQSAALRAILKQADDAYYNQQRSIMSDEAYDALRAQLEQLIADWPELHAESAVGAPAETSRPRVEHPAPVLSLQKVYSDDDLEKFIQRTGDALYCIEPKIDGLTVTLRYRNGFLVQAATRGDGKTGVDVTAAVLASGAVPVKLNSSPSVFDVRGEAFFTADNFAKLDGMKNARNAAAGTLMLSDFAEVARRNLSIQLFELLAADEFPATHTAALNLIRAAGLPAIESVTVPAVNVIDAVEKMNQRRNTLAFATDGIVIKMNSLDKAKQLGATAQFPRSAVARKYKPRPFVSRVTGVEWSRGETGKLTPVALFAPVEIDGATIQRASLYNADHLRAIDLRIGDWIELIRAGGAVPEITGVLKERRTGDEKEIHEPQNIE